MGLKQSPYMELPKPVTQGSLSVEEALQLRRSVRSYADQPLRVTHVAQLLWSAYGVTSPQGFRTAPSAKALYPLEISILIARVSGVPSGVYRYHPDRHELQKLRGGDCRDALSETTFDQEFIAEAPVTVIFSALYEKTRSEFGDAARDIVHMDLGHAAQNLHLQAVALGLGTVVVAAFRPDPARRVLGLPPEEVPLYLMPAGKLP